MSLFDSHSPIQSLHLFVVVFVVLAGFGCSGEGGRLFERRTPDQTGVHFRNVITEDDTLMNSLDYLYVYNGGGVATGDVNGDGRPDLYFAGNMVENRLYLNEGDFQFRDVTATAGVAAADVWSTGVTLVDINQDGRMDLYVSVGGPRAAGTDRANRLYVQQEHEKDGVPVFEERAEAYGIADTSYTTHAAFFDYDRDGDLDLYVLNNEMPGGDQNRLRPKRTDGQDPSTDRLYRNEGDGIFTDVSQEAGITIEGYGLGVAIGDVNKDGWPDVYVANDFITNDLLYINNGDGTFTNRIDAYLTHQSHSAMGVDLADFNNDARPDIMVLDMLPPAPPRRKVVSASYGYASPRRARRLGYELQYTRNTLQLNNGRTPDGRFRFSEIGQLAGVDATDWSWAPLFADFDNDGDLDLFVSNGYGEDVTNLDFARRRQQMLAFGTNASQREELLEAMKELPKVEVPNYFFMNDGHPGAASEQRLQFVDQTGTWASRKPGISNGAAVADLDGDGDLDLVTNNIDEEATLLENRASERARSHFLRIQLRGPAGNRGGLGAKVVLYNDGTRQYRDYTRHRGYQSTVEEGLHFGLGADSTADSVRVTWPDGWTQRRTNVPANREIEIRYDSTARRAQTDSGRADRSVLFRDETAWRGLVHEHEERETGDFEALPLLPHRLSQNGPGIAVGDLSGNGRDDVFVGAERGQKPVLFQQTGSGRFQKERLPIGAKYEDEGALVFDADGDGHRDLYVVSGGSAIEGGKVRPREEALFQDRLYRNDGAGNLRRVDDALPEVTASGSVVTAADYDGDGDLDLFVGGRLRSGEYPLPPRSYLLRNDSEAGEIRFTDVTEKGTSGLAEVGMVSDALWTDYNDDGRLDLMVVGEWMPITVFEQQEDGTFVDRTEEAGLGKTAGWWNSLAAGDFDRDGDMDYVAGNLGLNTPYEASPDEPIEVHARDFDQNGTIDPVLSHYVDGTRRPLPSRNDLIDQIPSMKRRFPSYRAYAEATFEDLFTKEEMEEAYRAEAVRFESSYLENQGDGTFAVRTLPDRIQTAPVFGMQTGDYTGNGFLDVLMVGNWHATGEKGGRANAFVGALLEGDGTGDFSYVHYTESGFFVDGDAKGLAEVATGGSAPLVVTTQNDDSLRAFSPSRAEGTVRPLRPLDRRAHLTYEDGTTRTEELFYGASYLSQSSRVLRIPEMVKTVTVTNSQGHSRTVYDNGSFLPHSKR